MVPFKKEKYTLMSGRNKLLTEKEDGFILITVIFFLFLSSLLFITNTQNILNQYRLQEMLISSYYEKAQLQILNKEELLDESEETEQVDENEETDEVDENDEIDETDL